MGNDFNSHLSGGTEGLGNRVESFLDHTTAPWNILIAVDHDVEREGIRALLEREAKWNICGEAATGSESIEKVRNLHPDLLLLDVNLPDMDAAEAIRQIKAVCPAIKIVALAMHDSGALAAKALAAGASGVAMKSDAASDLLLAICRIGNDLPFLSPAAVSVLQREWSKDRAAGPTPDNLTVRELQVLKLRAAGQTTKEVALRLGISAKTVDAHRTNIMQKLKLHTYSDLIRFAIRHNLVEI